MSSVDIRELVLTALFSGTARKSPDVSAVSRVMPLGNGGLGVSSLTLLNAFVVLERHFDIVFDDAAVASASFDTLGDLEDFISRFIGDRSIINAARP